MGEAFAGVWDGPVYRVRTDVATISYVPDAGEPLDGVCNVDAFIDLPDGSHWTATVFTLAEVARLMDRGRATGEDLAGAYFVGIDNVIVRDPGIEAMTTVLTHLVRAGDHEYVFFRVQDPTPGPGVT
jgi:hypothetical protein